MELDETLAEAHDALGDRVATLGVDARRREELGERIDAAGVRTAGQALVHSNIIANTKTGGVIGFDHARQISGDLAVKNSSHHSVFSNSNR